MIAAGCGGPTKIGSAGGGAGGKNGGVGNRRRRGCSQAQGGISAAPTASAACQWLLRARVELLCGVRAGTGVAAQGPPAQERLARPRGAAALPVHLQMRPGRGLPPWPPLGAAFFARTSWPGPVAAPPAAQSTQAGVLHREGKGIWANARNARANQGFLLCRSRCAGHHPAPNNPPEGCGPRAMTVAEHCPRSWLPALAAARPQAPSSDAQCDRAGRLAVQLSAPVPSSEAVAGLLLQAFVDSTAPQARSREAHPLPRSLEITVVGGAPTAAAPAAPAAQPPAAGEQQAQPAAPLVVQFAATDEAADVQQVEQAARLFEVRAASSCASEACPLSRNPCMRAAAWLCRWCRLRTAPCPCALPLHLLLTCPKACSRYSTPCRPTGACKQRQPKATSTSACGGAWRH